MINNFLGKNENYENILPSVSIMTSWHGWSGLVTSHVNIAPGSIISAGVSGWVEFALGAPTRILKIYQIIFD